MSLNTPAPALPPWIEGAGITVVVWLALVAIPVSIGHIGISWDALNHHIYLGWTAEGPRFGRDQLAASFQSYQYPYLYWPVYKLAASGASGVLAGVVLATLHATVVPAVWLIARSCIPGERWPDLVLRGLAVVLGFLSVVVLSMFDSTSNDLLSAVPLVWSVALALIAMERKPLLPAAPAVACSGLLAGLSVAFKLSNGPMAVLGPLLWVLAGSSTRTRVRMVSIGCAGAGLGFLLAYGFWGWQLWVHTGNPVYPFGDPYFEPLRRWLAPGP